MKKLLVFVTIIAVLFSMAPTTTALACPGGGLAPIKVIFLPYTDVKEKTKYHEEIGELSARGAFATIAKIGGKFYPKKQLTQKEVKTILTDMYGDKISVKVEKASKKVTQSWETKTLLDISTQLGYGVTWSGGTPKAKVTRSAFAYDVYRMIKVCPPLDPHYKK